jgi:hypothetical protein
MGILSGPGALLGAIENKANLTSSIEKGLVKIEFSSSESFS